jgi:ATP-dependent Lon protease
MARYNFRKRDANKSKVEWVEDDTLLDEEMEDEDYVAPSDEEESFDESMIEDMEIDDNDDDDAKSFNLKLKIPKGVSVDLHIEKTGKSYTSHQEDYDDGYEEDDEEEEDPFIEHLLQKYVPPSKLIANKKEKEKKKEKNDLLPAIMLNEQESDFFNTLSKAKRRKLNEEMKKVAYLVSDDDVPAKFRVLELPVSDSVKASVIKKIDSLEEMEAMDGGNEVHKLRSWVDGFLRIPFGKVVPLPVKIEDGPDSCGNFIRETREILDKAVYGMVPAKTQVMQTIAQWISNPNSIGNVIALKGPPGIGKTSIARNGIAKVLRRPFEFFSLGGATDSATFVGHSYTYEGSIWGRIADAVINARCMNPVMYFDELDKISTTAHGEEIASMLIHLTDRSQNTQFHDRYFAGVDFDLSQVLFVFSFNDEEKVHPILKDRMQVIDCSGYNPDEKKEIITRYVWPELIDRIKLDGLTIDDEAVKYMITEYSGEEQGVRTLIRCVETLMSRINLLRIADEVTAKSYKFYMKVALPHKITVDNVKHLLGDSVRQDNESWRRLYT